MGCDHSEDSDGKDHIVRILIWLRDAYLGRMGKGFGTGPVVELASSLGSKKKKKRLFEEKDELPGSIAGIVLQSPMTSVNSVLLPLLYILLKKNT